MKQATIGALATIGAGLLLGMLLAVIAALAADVRAVIVVRPPGEFPKGFVIRQYKPLPPLKPLKPLPPLDATGMIAEVRAQLEALTGETNDEPPTPQSVQADIDRLLDAQAEANRNWRPYQPQLGE